MNIEGLNSNAVVMYSLTAYFFIILCTSRGHRIHAFIIFTASIIGINMPDSDFFKETNTAILLDGITAFTLTMFLFVDRLAWKQAVILCFATLCHIMIIYDLTIASTWFSVFFYNYYDELIITVGLTQMAVSYDGMVNGITNLFRAGQRGVLRFFTYSSCNIQSNNIHYRKTKSEKGN